MAPPRVSNPKRSAKYYRSNPEARQKKAATDKKVNARPEQREKRSELTTERRRRGIAGRGGKDLSHTKDGKMVLENPSKNRARNRGKK
jgi:hypothetical protein